MADRMRRWRAVRLMVLTAIAFLGLKLIYFAAIQHRQPESISDNPEGLTIEFTVDRSAALTLENCVSGHWAVTGDTDEIRVNGEDWGAASTGEYQICNQLHLSPTLEVRLPSTAIASYKLEVMVVFADGLHLALSIFLICCAAYVIGMQTLSHRALITIMVCTHLGIVLWYQATTDLSITHSHRWGASLHTLPMADLQHDLWESFLYLHSQPPVFSAFGMGLDFLFGAALPLGMYIAHVMMGMMMCAMSYVTIWHYTKNKTFACFAGLLLALYPAYFFYEALGLYTMLSAFLVMTATICLVMYQRSAKSRYLYYFILMANLLILTRSVYHILILVPLLILVYLIARRDVKRVVICSLLICLLSVGWYGKNLFVHKSFSASSWMGMSLWKVARDNYRADELFDLYEQGVLTDRLVIWSLTFQKPSAYSGFTPIDNDIRVLSGDNSNNAVYPEINRLYLDNAMRLIRHDVGRYINGALRTYGYYSCPSSTWDALFKNRATLPASHQALSIRLVHMQSAAKRFAQLVNMSWDNYGVCSNLYFIMPLLTLGYPLLFVARCRGRWRCWKRRIRVEGALIYIWGAVAYLPIITSLWKPPKTLVSNS